MQVKKIVLHAQTYHTEAIYLRQFVLNHENLRKRIEPTIHSEEHK